VIDKFEPKYWRIAALYRRELSDRTPESEIYVGFADYTKAISQCETISEADLALLVDRFLAWKLPASVCSDMCVSNSNYPHPRYGTNLLNAEEARAMIRHLLAERLKVTE
jgi:hypothetical protein